jgi:hypothetical protein
MWQFGPNNPQASVVIDEFRTTHPNVGAPSIAKPWVGMQELLPPKHGCPIQDEVMGGKTKNFAFPEKWVG